MLYKSNKLTLVPKCCERRCIRLRIDIHRYRLSFGTFEFCSEHCDTGRSAVAAEEEVFEMSVDENLRSLRSSCVDLGGTPE